MQKKLGKAASLYRFTLPSLIIETPAKRVGTQFLYILIYVVCKTTG